MGLFKKLTTGGAKVGLCRGERAGHIGVWGKLDKSEELYRVVLNFSGVSRSERPLSHKVSYTFGPAHSGKFSQSVEMCRTAKEFLVGRDRAEKGAIVAEFYLSGNVVLTETYALETALPFYKRKGATAPVPAVRAWMEPDSKELAAIKAVELPAYSQKVKAELEEKRLKAEAEAKAKAEAAKKAAEDAAKAAQAKSAGAAKPVAADGAPIDRSKPTLPQGKVLMVYGSSTGNTKNVADAIKAELGDAVDQVKSITDIHPVDLTQFEKLILGIPTWHIGEMQDDWAAMAPEIEALNFAGKKVAVFGLGDGKGYAETYVDAMDELFGKFKGAQLVGLWPTAGYDFKKSKAIRDGKFMGLVIDVENQDHLSDKRIKAWSNQLKTELLG